MFTASLAASHAASRRRWVCRGVPLLLVLLVWAVYVPSLRLMLFHDDVLNAAWMSFHDLLTVFYPAFTLGGPAITSAEGRPVANVLWIATDALFGQFVPSLIHAWSVWAHVLNVALLIALARRLAHRVGFHSLIFAWTAGAIFGLFPLSYQAVIWAGSIYHPVMAACGLSALHVSLSVQLRPLVRYALTLFFLLAATLSQESGFVFGAIIIAVQFMLARGHLRRWDWAAVLAGASVFAYPLLFQLSHFIVRNIAPRNIPHEFGLNMGIFAQSFVAWLVLMLRGRTGLPPNPHAAIWLLFGVAVVLGGVGLWRMRLARLGFIGLLSWVISVVPVALVLDEAYVRFGPRLSYVPAIGIALFWGALTAGIWHRLKRPILRGVFGVLLVPLFVWCISYIQSRLQETTRLTPAMQMIDRAAQHARPNESVLLINMPWWNAPAYPDFWVGAEGMPIFQDGGPARLWLDFISGHNYQQVDYVRHPISFQPGPDWVYGVPGDDVDDAGLRQRILQAGFTFRFVYDAPGLRAEWVSRIEPAQTMSAPLAILQHAPQHAPAQVQLQAMQALRCGDEIQMELVWQVERVLTRPTAVFVHGHDAQGQQVLVADRDLLRGYMPLEQVPAGLRITERREIQVPAGAAVAEMRLGAFDRETGQRLLAQQGDGVAWPADEVRVPIVAGCRS